MADEIGGTMVEQRVQGGDVYVPAPGAVAVHADGGALAVGFRSSQAVRLNPTGSLVWQVLGDDLTVAELADELSEAFGITPDAALADLAPLFESLLDRGLLIELTRSAPDAAPAKRDVPHYVTIPPCGCLRTVDDMDWAALTAVRVGDDIIGVRSNDLGAHQLLEAALAPIAIDDPNAAGFYSVELVADPSEEAPLRLWAGNSVACRTLDLGVLWSSLRMALSRHDPMGGGLLELEMTAIVGPAGAVLLPDQAAASLLGGLDALAERGIRVAMSPVALDLASGEIVVGAGIAFDDSAAAGLTSLLGTPTLHDWASPGRYPLAAFPAEALLEGDSLARVHALTMALLPFVLRPERLDPDAALSALGSLAERLRIVDPPEEWGVWAPWVLDILG